MASLSRARLRPLVPIMLVLLAGLALRVVAMIAVFPAVIAPYDPGVYIYGARTSLFNDLIHPAGYPLFLRALHWVSPTLAAVTVTQHILGLAGGLLAYLTGRRLGLSPVWAAVPAALVLFAGGQLDLEHIILSDSLYTFLMLAAIYAAVRARDAGVLVRAVAWAAAAGVLIGVGVWVRSVGNALAPVVALWLLWVTGPAWRRRLAVTGGFAAACLAALVVYAAANQHYTGDFALGRGNGRALYSRAAQFADCRQFTPPPGTRPLCETTPPADRPGPTSYFWAGTSPAVRLFGIPPRGDALLGRFGRAAIKAQPLDYLDSVASDAARYVVEPDRVRPGGGEGFNALDITISHLDVAPVQNRQFPGYYTDFLEARERGAAGFLAAEGRVFEVKGVLLVVLLLLALAGLVRATPAIRRGIVLTLAVALVLFLAPIATLSFSARYAVPPEGPLAIAGVLGAVALISARRPRARC